MSGGRGDRWVSVLLSVLVHGAIVALLGWGWWFFRRPAPAARTLAIEGQVIDSATLASVACCALPRAVKALRMPQTVPNRPT